MGDAACSCPYIKQGSEVTEHKNWNPYCDEHGIDSAWYNSEEQVAKRAEDRARLIEMQRLAREKRRQAYDE